MLEIDAGTALAYLGTLPDESLIQMGITRENLATARARELAWGVSNIVLLIESDAGDFVLKQSRRQLRTRIDWFSRLDRIWREVDVLRALANLLPVDTVPRVRFEDRENYLFAMDAIESDHRVWKADLLAGRFDLTVAVAMADSLATVHHGSTGDTTLAATLADRTVFDELRLDPFYRYVADHDDRVRRPLIDLIDATLSRRDCLVLADFSPKNILLTSGPPAIVDFETGHFGDPGFDLGFLLSHLLLKTVFHADRWREAIALPTAFWSEYVSRIPAESVPVWFNATCPGQLPFEARCVKHLAACMLARIDGKSPVDYLTTEAQQTLVRNSCHELLNEDVPEMAAVFSRLADRIAATE